MRLREKLNFANNHRIRKMSYDRFLIKETTSLPTINATNVKLSQSLIFVITASFAKILIFAKSATKPQICLIPTTPSNRLTAD